MFSVLVGCYATVSYVCLKFPWIFSARFRSVKITSKCKVLHGSHRGGAAEQPENTLLAFRNAIKQGGQLLELDCYLTKDEQVVVVHDDCLDRLSDTSNVFVRQTNYSDLPLIKFRPILPPPFHDKTAVLEESGPSSNISSQRKMPLLSEIFEEFPEATINIDCKHDSRVLVEKTVDLIKKFKREDRSIVGSFSAKTTLMIRKLGPELQTIFSAKETLFVYLSFIFGALPFIKLSGNYLEVPFPGAYILRRIDLLLGSSSSWFKKFAGDLLKNLATGLLLNKTLYEHLQARGVKVIFWVLNEENDMEYAIKTLKADGVMTDFPNKLTNVLNKVNPQWNK